MLYIPEYAWSDIRRELTYLLNEERVFQEHQVRVTGECPLCHQEVELEGLDDVPVRAQVLTEDRTSLEAVVRRIVEIAEGGPRPVEEPR